MQESHLSLELVHVCFCLGDPWSPLPERWQSGFGDLAAPFYRGSGFWTPILLLKPFNVGGAPRALARNSPLCRMCACACSLGSSVVYQVSPASPSPSPLRMDDYLMASACEDIKAPLQPTPSLLQDSQSPGVWS